MCLYGKQLVPHCRFWNGKWVYVCNNPILYFLIPALWCLGSKPICIFLAWPEPQRIYEKAHAVLVGLKWKMADGRFLNQPSKSYILMSALWLPTQSSQIATPSEGDTTNTLQCQDVWYLTYIKSIFDINSCTIGVLLRKLGPNPNWLGSMSLEEGCLPVSSEDLQEQRIAYHMDGLLSAEQQSTLRRKKGKGPQIRARTLIL